MGSGGGGTAQGLEDYQQDFHNLIMAGMSVDAAPKTWQSVAPGSVDDVYIKDADYADNPSVLRFIIDKGITDAGGNPYEGASAYDPSEDLATADERFEDFLTLVEALDPATDWGSFLDSAQAEKDTQVPALDVDDIFSSVISEALSRASQATSSAFDAAKNDSQELIDAIVSRSRDSASSAMQPIEAMADTLTATQAAKDEADNLIDTGVVKADASDLLDISGVKADVDSVTDITSVKTSVEELLDLSNVKSEASDLLDVSKVKIDVDSLVDIGDTKLAAADLLDLEAIKSDAAGMVSLADAKTEADELTDITGAVTSADDLKYVPDADALAKELVSIFDVKADVDDLMTITEAEDSASSLAAVQEAEASAINAMESRSNTAIDVAASAMAASRKESLETEEQALTASGAAGSTIKASHDVGTDEDVDSALDDRVTLADEVIATEAAGVRAVIDSVVPSDTELAKVAVENALENVSDRHVGEAVTSAKLDAEAVVDDLLTDLGTDGESAISTAVTNSGTDTTSLLTNVVDAAVGEADKIYEDEGEVASSMITMLSEADGATEGVGDAVATVTEANSEAMIDSIGGKVTDASADGETAGNAVFAASDDDADTAVDAIQAKIDEHLPTRESRANIQGALVASDSVGDAKALAKDLADTIHDESETKALATAGNIEATSQALAKTAMSDISEAAEPEVNALISGAINEAMVGASSAMSAALASAKDAVDGAPIAAMVAAYRKRALTQHLRSINRLAGGMADINAVNSSAFIIGMALQEAEFTNNVNDFQAKIELQIHQQVLPLYVQTMQNTMGEYIRSHLAKYTENLGIYKTSLPMYLQTFLSVLPEYFKAYAHGFSGYLGVFQQTYGASLTTGLGMETTHAGALRSVTDMRQRLTSDLVRAQVDIYRGVFTERLRSAISMASDAFGVANAPTGGRPEIIRDLVAKCFTNIQGNLGERSEILQALLRSEVDLVAMDTTTRVGVVQDLVKLQVQLTQALTSIDMQGILGLTQEEVRQMLQVIEARLTNVQRDRDRHANLLNSMLDSEGKTSDLFGRMEANAYATAGHHVDSKLGVRKDHVNATLSGKESYANMLLSVKQRYIDSVLNDRQQSISTVLSNRSGNAETVLNSKQRAIDSVLGGKQGFTGAVLDSKHRHTGTVIDGRQRSVDSVISGKQGLTGAVMDSRDRNISTVVDARRGYINAMFDKEQKHIDSILDTFKQYMDSKLRTYIQTVAAEADTFGKEFLAHLNSTDQTLSDHFKGTLGARLQEDRERQQFTLHSVDVLRSLQAVKLDKEQDATITQFDLSKINVAAKVEEAGSNLEYDFKSANWDMELFGMAGNVLSAVTGAVVPGAGKPSRTASTLAGAAAGAGIGAKAGGSIGAAIGGPAAPATAALGAGIGTIAGALGGGIAAYQ